MSFYDSTHTGPQIDDAIDIVEGRLTTVGTPGSDNSIVSEQGIREALDLKLNKGTSLVLREHVLIAGSTEYPTIQSAINAASSPSSTNRYTVLVLPGLYTEQITMVDYVNLVGMDRLSCRIANDNRVIAPVSNTTISNLSVYYSGTNYAIEPTSAIQDFEMQNVYIEALTGIGVRFRSIGGVKHNSVVLTNVGIKARSGILHSYEGYWTMRDCIIQLYGQDYGVNRFGVEFAGGSRCMLFGCNIFSPWAGSGENITGTGDDVYGIYIPSTVTSNDLKIHLYNCNITVRNEDDANVNCIRMMGTNENASVRVFGGRYLCETPIGTKRAFYAGNAGQIELFGPYYKSGTAGGGPIRGWGYESIDNSTFTFVAFDDVLFKDMQCNKLIVDTEIYGVGWDANMSVPTKDAVYNKIENHITDTSNPHSVTKAQIGLGSVKDGADVTGPSSSTDGHVTLFNGTTGKLIKDSGISLGSIATQNSNAVSISGGTITGISVLDMDSHTISNVLDPSADQDAATKKYVDDNVGGGDNVINVKDYGAVGDGSTDDTSAIQSAIDAVTASGESGNLYFPPGTYVVSDGNSDGACLLITESIHMWGSNWDSMILGNDADAHIIKIASDGEVFLHAFCITYSGSITPSTGMSCIFVTDKNGDSSNKNSYFSNLKLQYGYYGIHFERAAYWCVSRCRVDYYWNTGIVIENLYNSDQGDSVVTDTLFTTGKSGAYSGIYYKSSGGVRFIGNKFLGATSYGLKAYAKEHAGSGGLNSWIVVGNSFEGTNIYSIDIEGYTSTPATITISSNEIMNGIRLRGASGHEPLNIAITGNVFNTHSGSTGTSNIRIDEGSEILVTGNIFRKYNSVNSNIYVALGAECNEYGNLFWDSVDGERFAGSGTISHRVFNNRVVFGEGDSPTEVIAKGSTTSFQLYSGSSKRGKFITDGNNEYIDYTGILYFRNPCDSTHRAYLTPTGNLVLTGGLTLGTDLSIANGGTGASTASDARSNLGLGSIATQNSNSVSIAGGTITGVSLTGNMNIYVNGTESSFTLQRDGVKKVRLMAYSTASTYLDYDGSLYLRSGINGTNRVAVSPVGNMVLSNGSVDAFAGFKVNGTAGVSGSFTTADSKTVTVTNGIITSIE